MAIRSRKTLEAIGYALVKAFNTSRKRGVRSPVTNADATDAATAVTLVNEIKGLINALAVSHYDPTSASGDQGDFRDPAATTLSVLSANATDAATLLTLTNEIKVVYSRHIADAVAHDLADATNVVTNADATNTATAVTLLNEIKGDHNTHLTEAGVHPNDDNTNDVTNANATDEATAITLANEIKADVNAHIASAPDGTAVELVTP